MQKHERTQHTTECEVSEYVHTNPLL